MTRGGAPTVPLEHCVSERTKRRRSNDAQHQRFPHGLPLFVWNFVVRESFGARCGPLHDGSSARLVCLPASGPTNQDSCLLSHTISYSGPYYLKVPIYLPTDEPLVQRSTSVHDEDDDDDDDKVEKTYIQQSVVDVWV